MSQITLSSGVTSITTVDTNDYYVIGNATLVVVDGGVASGQVYIDSGGSQLVVGSGGTTSNAVVANGSMAVLADGVDSGTWLGGNYGSSVETIFSGGVSVSALVSPIDRFRLAAQNLQSGAIAIGATLSYGGAQYVSAGGIASGTSHLATLNMLGNYVAGNFHLANDGAGGTLVTDPPVSSGQSLAAPS